MNKIIMLTLVAVSLHSGLNAQNNYSTKKVRFGFKLDPVLTNVLKPTENDINRTGGGFSVNYGLMADIMFKDERAVFATGLEVTHASSELVYSSAGKGLYRNDAGEANQNYKLRLQYLQIPLSLKLKTGKVNDNFKLWGQFGTYMGALIRSRLDYSYGTTSDDNVNIMSKTNKLNMGLLIGAGGEYRLAEKTDLFFGLGYENGFTDVTKNKDWDDGKVKLARWAIRLGVFF